MFPHVSTEALVCAVVLSEEGNLGRTAERLHTSNTSVGRKVIKMLQKGWGIVFFCRTMHGFELTQEGRSAIQSIDLAAAKLGIALVPRSAARFQCPGVLFKTRY